MALSGERGDEGFDQKRMGIGRPHQSLLCFLHGNAFAEAGHEVRIFLLGEAVKDELIDAVTPVGWPPLAEIMAKTLAHRIAISV